MAHANPWQHATGHRVRAREVKTFTDAVTGYSLTLCFEELDEPAAGQAADLFEEHRLKYLLTGKNGEPLRKLPTPVGPARLSERLLRRMAMFQTQERPGLDTDIWPAGEGPSGVSFWYGVASQHDDLWEQVSLWAVTIGQLDADGQPIGGTASPPAPATPTTEGSDEP